TLAQGNLLAAWLAWSEGPFLKRLARHWVVIASLYCVWAIGVVLAALPKEVQMICLTIALAVPLVSVAAQFPLWIARQWFGWRITRAGSEDELVQERPLTIRGLMLATLVGAVAFTLGRVVPRRH